MKTDCFAYKETTTENGTFGECTATIGKDCKNCSFYKTKNQEDSELMKYNGSTDMNRILRKYATIHSGT